MTELATSIMQNTEVANAAKVAELMQVDIRSVQRYVDSGKIRADTSISALGGGKNGTAYRVYVDSLPIEAQIRYWQESAQAELGHGGAELDLVGYRARYGEEGMAELLQRQRAVLAAHGLRLKYDEQYGGRGYTAALEQLAEQFGVPYMTLYRWERRYNDMGLAGLIRKGRKDKGESRSMCLLARDYVEFLMCSQSKRPQNWVLTQVQRAAEERGADACEHCPYRRLSEERNELVAVHAERPPTCDRAGGGMIPPDTRDAVNRAVQLIPESVLVYARYGSRYWEANFMQKTKREKPELANECWFGDHHMFDLFVLDRDGRAVRPWLTAWMDAKTSALVGWMLTLNPNSDTIAESFARGAVTTKGSPFRGLPRVAYIDNGKDYRSKRFEGDQETVYDVGRLNDEFCEHGLLETLGVGVIHAIPYRAWAKPIERMFGVIEDHWIRDMPGWCGGAPDQRPQDLSIEIKRLMERGELMTFDTFAEIFARDVITGYHNQRGADGLTPLERYAQSERARKDDPDWATMAMLKSQQTKRTVTYQGVRLDSQLYQDQALAELVGTEVTILHQRGINSSVTVMHNGRFVCEAEPLETLRMLETDEEKLGRHMANQRTQRRTVTSRIAAVEQQVKGIHREAYAEEIDEQRDRALARVGNLQGRKVQQAKAAVEGKRRRRKGELNESERRANELFGALGAEVLSRAKEG